MSQFKTRQLNLWLRPADLDLIETAAALTGQRRTDFAAGVLVEVAREVVARPDPAEKGD